jgi:hypothetical protein
MTYLNSQKGYTLIFAVIVSSIILSIGAFILSISRKQFILSSAARDSTKAIYAADSGTQCAVEAHSNLPAMNFSCYNISSQPFSFSQPIDDLASSFDPNRPSGRTPPIYVYIPNNGTCAKITMASGTDPVKAVPKFYIESRGYSMGNASGCPTSNPRNVERAIYVIYRN